MDTSPDERTPRAQSATRYPYFDLEASAEVARVMHLQGGGTFDLNHLSSHLNYSSVSNGAFRMRLSAAKQFGLIDGNDESGLRVTKRGLAIVAPVSEGEEATARLEAFMSVDLFKSVYRKFEGASLPAESGLRNLFRTQFGIVEKQVATAVRVMLDSASQAGLFKTAGRSRMVIPLNASSNGMGDRGEDSAAPPRQDEERSTPPPFNPTGGGGGNAENSIDPALMGLLMRLPKPGQRLSPSRRKSLVEAFTATIDFIYPEDEDLP